MEGSRGRESPVRERTALQTASWRMLRDEWARDTAAEAEYSAWERERARTRPEIATLVARFTGGEIGLEEFRRIFDRRTRTDWDAFGLRGASGAMLVNSLAKHASDPVALAEALRDALRAPNDEGAADLALRALLDHLGHVFARSHRALTGAPSLGLALASPIQPARAVFFASMCWHVQQPDRWPAYHLSSRHILHAEEEVFVPGGDPVSDYVAFRASFLSLVGTLKLTTWQLEHLCWWQQRRLEREGDSETKRANADASFAERRFRRAVGARRTRRASGESVADARRQVGSGDRLPLVREAASSRCATVDARRGPGAPEPPPEDRRRPAVDHTHVQWLLAKVGGALGCAVWVAPNDWSREYADEPLKALSIAELPPLGMDAASQRVVAAIDIVWLTGHRQVAAAFEVEHTTAVYSGLLRMADLVSLSPNLNFPLYIVAPEARLAKVTREIQRPTFRSLDLDQRCGFFSSEALLESAASLMKWGSGARAIDRLAERVGDARAHDRVVRFP